MLAPLPLPKPLCPLIDHEGRYLRRVTVADMEKALYRENIVWQSRRLTEILPLKAAARLLGMPASTLCAWRKAQARGGFQALLPKRCRTCLVKVGILASQCPASAQKGAETENALNAPGRFEGYQPTAPTPPARCTLMRSAAEGNVVEAPAPGEDPESNQIKE